MADKMELYTLQAENRNMRALLSPPLRCAADFMERCLPHQTAAATDIQMERFRHQILSDMLARQNRIHDALLYSMPSSPEYQFCSHLAERIGAFDIWETGDASVLKQGFHLLLTAQKTACQELAQTFGEDMAIETTMAFSPNVLTEKDDLWRELTFTAEKEKASDRFLTNEVELSR